MGSAAGRIGRFQEPWVDCPMPTGWTWTDCPVIPQRSVYDRYRFRAWDRAKHKVFDARDYAPTGATVYYVDIAAGDDGNTGADWANALKGVKTAVAKGDQDIIYVKAGTYPYGYGWEGTSTARAFSVIAVDGQAILSNHYGGLSWAQDPANLPAYKATVPAAVWSVWDAATLDAYGNYTKLTLKANAAEVAANAGSWYISGTDIWVQTADSREPDANVRCYADSSGAIVMAGATNYIEGLTSEGSNTAGIYANVDGLVYCKNCKAAYTEPTDGDGFQMLKATAIFQNCEAAKAGKDGFNYHANAGAISDGIEIDCSSHDIGSDADDQCSTAHDGGQVLAINSTYLRSALGQAVKDISENSKRWALGCTANTGSLVCWSIGASTNSAFMWLDGCDSQGAALAFEAEAGSTLYYRNPRGAVSGNGAGTVSQYDGVNPASWPASCIDTYIADQTAAVQTYNYGVLPYLRLRVPGGSPGCKALLFFDLSAIPTGSTCNSATLYLYHHTQGAALASTVTIYSIKAANGGWVEGTKAGTAAGAGQPCWDAKEADGAGGVTTAWAGAEGLATADTDYVAAAIGTFNGNRSDVVGTEYSAALTAAVVETWFGAANSNYGMLLVATGALEYVYSSEHGSIQYRPRLVVDFTAP